MARPQAFDMQDVLQSAMQVFWQKGYHATSLMDLLSATGLSKSSLYAAFESKHGLFLRAFDFYRSLRRREMMECLAMPSARAGLECFFRQIVRDSRSSDSEAGCLSINQAVELAETDLQVRQRVGDDFRAMKDLLEQAICRAQVQGDVSGRLSAAHLADVLLLSFPGLQVLSRSRMAEVDLEEKLQSLFHILD